MSCVLNSDNLGRTVLGFNAGPRQYLHVRAHCCSIHNSKEMGSFPWPSTGSWIRSWYIHTMEFNHPWRKRNYEKWQQNGCENTQLRQIPRVLSYMWILCACVPVCDRGVREIEREEEEKE